MITKNTIIITGAGANTDYGFPNGSQLKQCIIDNYIDLFDKYIYHENDAFEASLDKNYRKDIEEFIKIYRRADIPIDDFISRHKKGDQYQDLAKLAITLSILIYEKNNVPKGSWLNELFSQITETVKTHSELNNIKNNNLSFITFNYDRVIEHYFYAELDAVYGFDNNTDKSILSPFEALHVYGKLADLNWQSNLINKLTYGASNKSWLGNFGYLLKNNINLIRYDEEIQSLSSYNKIRSKLKKAERLYILGFAYNEYNVKVLGFPDSIPNVKSVYSTVRGLNRNVIDRLKNQYFKDVRIKKIDYNDCNELIKNEMLTY